MFCALLILRLFAGVEVYGGCFATMIANGDVRFVYFFNGESFNLVAFFENSVFDEDEGLCCEECDSLQVL